MSAIVVERLTRPQPSLGLLLICECLGDWGNSTKGMRPMRLTSQQVYHKETTGDESCRAREFGASMISERKK